MRLEVGRVDIDPAKIMKKRGMGSSRDAQCFLASTVQRFCDPYVPMAQGTLKNTSQVLSDGSGVLYPQPYAHYQYEGKVMGPNVPLTEGGQVVGFFSPRAPKHYTGGGLQYHGAPTRGPYWDKRMMADRRTDVVDAFAGYVGGERE